MDEVWPEAQAHVARELGTRRCPTRSSLLSNTHDFLVRLLTAAAAPSAGRTARPDQRRRIPQRPPPVRALGGGRLDQPSNASRPSRSTPSPSAFSRRAKRRARSHPGQPGAVRQRADLRAGRRARGARPARRAVGRDRRLSRLHGARPAVRRSRRGKRLLPRRRLQICDGGRRLRVPARAAGLRSAAADHRLVRRVRGLEPAAAAASAMPRTRRRFLGATFDPVGALSLQRRAADAAGERPDDRAHFRSCRGAAAAIARRDRRDGARQTPSCSTRSTAARTRASSPSAVPTRSAGTRSCKAQNCITDVRGDVLRIGFGIYQDEDDVDRLVGLLGGLA